MTASMAMFFLQALAQLVILSLMIVGSRYVNAKRHAPDVDELLSEARRRRREEDREAMREWETAFYGTPPLPVHGATADDVARWYEAHDNYLRRRNAS
jgi:hypothetical protein